MNVVRCKAASRICFSSLEPNHTRCICSGAALIHNALRARTMIMSMDIAPCAGTVSGGTCGPEIEAATKAKQM
jgi:hypothetical protein